MHLQQSSLAMRGDLRGPSSSVVGPLPGADAGRILIVDDNQINRRILIAMMDRNRHTLLSAADGDQALTMARADPPDLILLDIIMPGKDGYQVCAELKADSRTEHVPVIFLSALSETADKIKGLELGAVDYITKPFDQGEVVARMRNQLKLQRLASEVLRANRALRDKQRLRGRRSSCGTPTLQPRRPSAAGAAAR